MAFIPASQTHFTQSGSTPGAIAVPAGAKVTVQNVGATLYYKSTKDVTSSSNDGNIASGSSSTFTSPQWVITAQGASTEVFVSNEDTISEDLRVGDDLVAADTVTSTTAAPFVTGISPNSSPTGIANWQPVAATSGTDTTPADGTQFVTSIFVPVNKTITNVNYLIGSVGGTDKVYAVIYDSSGADVANTSLTGGGATVGTAANVQTLALTSTYAAVGPARYFVGISMNGNTARLRTVPAHTQSGLLAGSVSQTHGTVADITAPSTFTADKAPVVFLN